MSVSKQIEVPEATKTQFQTQTPSPLKDFFTSNNQAKIDEMRFQLN